MEKKYIYLAFLLIFLSGCTGTNEGSEEPVDPSGIMNFAYNINPTSIRQGDVSIITMTVSNFYDKPLENIDIRFEPTFSGITFRTDGPKKIEPKGTGTWIVDVQTTSGAIPKEYLFRPVICFDYSQDKRAYFRVAPSEPSTRDVDYSTSDNGPLNINIQNLRGINAQNDFNQLDLLITYSYANNYQGLTNNTSPANQLITYGKAELESKDLRLRALQGSSRMKFLNPSNYCRYLSSGLSICEFPNASATVNLESQFGFMINVSSSLESELETYFLNSINYTLCLRPSSDFAIEVVKAQ